MMVNNVLTKEETILNEDNLNIEGSDKKIYKRGDTVNLNIFPSDSGCLNKAKINRELIMVQQMCMNFGKPYSLRLATEYLNKIGINVCETDVENMYLKEEINFISDHRENRKIMLENFFKKRNT